MSSRYSDIDVMTCVQGNTARKTDLYGAAVSGAARGNLRYKTKEQSDFGVVRDRCVVYDFRREAAAPARTRYAEAHPDRTVRAGRQGRTERKAANGHASKRNPSRKASARKAARARARRALVLRTALFTVLVIFTILGIGGIASRAKSREVPAAYKYYDTITVGYRENLLDIVERYDDRDHYETQLDYVEELCRINNLAFDGTAYPVVTPGTHLVVPYYSAELK